MAGRGSLRRFCNIGVHDRVKGPVLRAPGLSFFSFFSSSRLLQKHQLRNFKMNNPNCSLLAPVWQLPYRRCMATRKGQERR
nr:MAG TPA: hypothetical protein [Caudoviricetes sp.]